MPSKPDPDRLPHPGRTSAERRALDRIGCGEPPACSQKTLRNQLDTGLIVDVGTETRRDALGAYKIPKFAMPIPVHMAWCSAVAATDEEMAAFEAELEGL
ncbi:hypothetical protein MKK67_11235 [Methylobacterium sp. J-072]|uniref:hypothetical protein n=1 Tax=Methylobacterium sp. J-072 TaxID=2836651 RepID=UPI001FB90FE5|nr:hypothetical protein [Methylobacterium sp. J-072]MCJ2093067.1 hypothetical protein [Methylobacterium sp. J-072]